MPKDPDARAPSLPLSPSCSFSAFFRIQKSVRYPIDPAPLRLRSRHFATPSGTICIYTKNFRRVAWRARPTWVCRAGCRAGAACSFVARCGVCGAPPPSASVARPWRESSVAHGGGRPRQRRRCDTPWENSFAAALLCSRGAWRCGSRGVCHERAKVRDASRAFAAGLERSAWAKLSSLQSRACTLSGNGHAAYLLACAPLCTTVGICVTCRVAWSAPPPGSRPTAGSTTILDVLPAFQNTKRG